jgi:nucleotide-binding universal stress UspA family protein
MHCSANERRFIVFKTIAFATDGSPACEHAGDYVASLARCYTAHVLVLSVAIEPPIAMSEPYYHHSLLAGRQRAAVCVEDVRMRLRDQGITDVEMAVLEGPPVEVILDVLEERTPELLVIGARGISPWKGLMLGSVSLALTQRARCPVLVIK